MRPSPAIRADSFEQATEYGVPVAQGPPVEAALLGYDFVVGQAH